MFGQQDPFAGLADAKITQQGIYMQSGFDGDVMPRRVWAQDVFQKGLMFFVEFEITVSNHPNHPVGQVCTWTVKMQNANALGNVKEFATATQGADPNNDQHVAALTPQYDSIIKSCWANNTSNACTQRPVHLKTHTKPNKKSPGVFTHHRWSPATGEAGPPPTPEDLAISQQKAQSAVPAAQTQLPWQNAGAPAAAPAQAAAPPWQPQAPAQAPQAPAGPWQPPVAPQAPQAPAQAPQAPPWQAPAAPPVAAVPPPAGAPQAPGFANAPNPFNPNPGGNPPWQR